MQGVESRVRRIELREIIDVRTGITGSPVLKRYDLPKEVDNLMLSVITSKRSLDLKASDPATRNRWVKYFASLIAERKQFNYQAQKFESDSESKQVCSRYRYYAEKMGKSCLPLDEIWENTIMTHFDQHWDYLNHRPCSVYVEPYTQKSSSTSMFSCMSPVKRPHTPKQITFRLDDFWRFGIPAQYRKALWPFAI